MCERGVPAAASDVAGEGPVRGVLAIKSLVRSSKGEALSSGNASEAALDLSSSKAGVGGVAAIAAIPGACRQPVLSHRPSAKQEHQPAQSALYGMKNRLQHLSKVCCRSYIW